MELTSKYERAHIGNFWFTAAVSHITHHTLPIPPQLFQLFSNATRAQWREEKKTSDRDRDREEKAKARPARQSGAVGVVASC